MILTDYLSLIPSQHKDKPNFMAMTSADVAPYEKIQNVLTDIPNLYDVDLAIGSQLDIIGEWVGISRRVATPLTGVYFEWDGLALVGWDSGTWMGEFDSASGLNNLPDDSYRLLIKTKIAANSWNGSITMAYDIWETIFTSSYIIIQDNQDMTMTVGISGDKLGAVDQALLTGGYIPLKPMGVAVSYYAITIASGALFGWDTSTAALSGWDSGQWALEI